MTDGGLPAVPRITVGLAVYNGERWISEAISSILRQSFRDFELLISDNCSTDRTWEICSAFAREDQRVRLVKTPYNVGAAENFNRLCRDARGEYFKYSSCSDYVSAELLERCVEILDRHDDVVVCHTQAYVVDEDTGKVAEYEHGLSLLQEDPVERFESYLDLVRLNNVEHGLIRTKCFEHCVLQAPFVGSDINFMAELALQGKFQEVPERLFYRRIGAKTLTSSRSKREIYDFYSPGREILFWQNWKRILSYTGMVLRAPLRFRERLRLAVVVATMWRVSRGVLFADIWQAIRHLFRSGTSSSVQSRVP